MKRSLRDTKRAVELAARPLTLIAIAWLLDDIGTETALPRKNDPFNRKEGQKK